MYNCNWRKIFSFAKYVVLVATNVSITDSESFLINSFLLFALFTCRERKLFTREVKVQTGKNTFIVRTLKWRCRLWRETINFPLIFSLIGRTLSIFRQKMNGPNLSDMNIKKLIVAPACSLQSQFFSLIGKMRRFTKFKQQVWKNKNDVKKSCCFMHSASSFSSFVFVFRNKEGLIALLVYSSFRGVATSMLQRISVFNSSGSQVDQAERK